MNAERAERFRSEKHHSQALVGSSGESDDASFGWETLTTTGELARTQNVRLQLAGVHAIDTAIELVNVMHRDGGGTVVYSGSVLGRCLRDIHTISQHAAFGVEHYEAAGRALLGLDPAPPLA